MARDTRAGSCDPALVFCRRVARLDVSEATPIDMESANAEAIRSSLLLTMLARLLTLGIEDFWGHAVRRGIPARIWPTGHVHAERPRGDGWG